LVIATGSHPKMTVMRLSGERRTRDAVSQAFEYFEMPEPQLQAVTIRNELFDRSLAWQLVEDESRQSDNIIEFKKSNGSRVKSCFRTLRSEVTNACG
jgi:hypothetical protein